MPVKLARSNFIYESPDLSHWLTYWGIPSYNCHPEMSHPQVSSQVYLYNKASSAWPLLTQPYLCCVSLRSGLSYYLQSAGTLGLNKHDGKETRCLIPSSPPGFDASAVIMCLNKLPVVLASSHGLLSVYKQ